MKLALWLSIYDLIVPPLRSLAAAVIFLLALGITSGCMAKLSPDPYYLDANQKSLHGNENIHGNLQWGRVYWQQEVWIENIRYQHAIGMHPPVQGVGYAEFSIPAHAKYFQTIFGLARDDNNPYSYGEAAGLIYIDGIRVWKGTASGPRALPIVRIPIPEGAKRLRLVVDPLGTNWGDHATWVNALFSGSK